jgi:hypothetical protein
VVNHTRSSNPYFTQSLNKNLEQKLYGRMRLAFESREYELVQQENGVARLLRRWRWRCIYRPLSRNWPLGSNSSSGQCPGGARQCSAGPDLIRSGVSVKCI